MTEKRELMAKAIRHRELSENEAAIECAKSLLSESLSTSSVLNVAVILIDCGFDIRDGKSVRAGCELLEKQIAADLIGEQACIAFYNLGNGYNCLYLLEEKDSSSLFSEVPFLAKAQKYYLDAKDLRKEIGLGHAETLVNLGNVYKAQGRTVDALDCYHDALVIDPEHTMALANRGAALVHLSVLAGKKRGAFLLEALRCLETALAGDLRDESRSHFGEYRDYIFEVFGGQVPLSESESYPGISFESFPPETREYLRFCIDKELFLNICGTCQKCDNAVGDKAGLDFFMVTAGEMLSPELTSNGRFYRVAYMLNKIKLDYATARYLLACSILDSGPCDQVDSLVRYEDVPLPFSKSTGDNLLQIAFKTLYDLLDKIAVFINDYLGLNLPEKYTHFVWFWYQTNKKKNRAVLQAMRDTQNEYLNALFHLAVELDKETGNSSELTLLRHRITHGFLHLVDREPTDNNQIRKSELASKTIQLARIVRSAIIYVLSMVREEEQKKASSSEPLPPIWRD